MKTPQNDSNHPLNTHAVAELLDYMVAELERGRTSLFRKDATGLDKSELTQQLELLRLARDAAQRRDALALLGVGCELVDRLIATPLGSWLKSLARGDEKFGSPPMGLALPTNEEFAAFRGGELVELPELTEMARWIRHDACALTGSNLDAFTERILAAVRDMAKRYGWHSSTPA